MHARYRGATPQDRAPQTEKMPFPEKDLAAQKCSGEAKVTRTTSYVTWTALTSRPAKTRRTSVMISSSVLSASLWLTCKLIVFGRHMIKKAKKQKAKKRKGKKRQRAKSRLESKDANPHSKNENIPIGDGKTPIVWKRTLVSETLIENTKIEN